MAQIVFGGATSHGPLTILPWEDWLPYGESDRRLPLYKNGCRRDFDDLVEEAGDSLLAELAPPVLEMRATAIQSALDRLAADIATAALDVLVIISDDQGEMFDPSSVPTLAVYDGDEARTKVVPLPDGAPQWLRRTVVGLGLDEERTVPSSPGLARDLIASLVEQGFDVAPCRTNGDQQRGLGHGFTFPYTRLLKGGPVRILPILLNTYYPPNQPTPSRCFDLGLALRQAVEASSAEERVGVLASGGLSHFVVEEDLDAAVLDAIHASDRGALDALPTERLVEGSSEIRNWIAAAGTFSGYSVAWSEYVPGRRTKAGSGCANAFLRWDEG